MAFNQALPEWLKTGVAPAAPKRAEGWQVEEHPPAEWFNWQWNLTFLALQELQQNAAHLDGSGTFSGPIKSSVANGTAPLVVASNTLVANLNADRVDGMDAATAATASTIAARDASGDLTARVLKSGVATGTAPLTVASTTVVANLNADMVDGLHTATAATANSVAARDGNGDLTARRLISNVAAGTAPFAVTSNTVVANLNADMADGYHFDQDVRTGASPSFVRATFTQAAGTAPFTVSSDTKVANLNADEVDGYHADAAATANTLAARDGGGNLVANTFASTVANGTAPFTVVSTTGVPNLNADMVDGYHLNQDVRSTASPTFVTPTVTRLVSTQVTGTAPFTVASQTLVANLNVDLFDGYHAGNASGQVPVSNGTVNTNLNADMLDGMHANSGTVANTIVSRDASGDFAGRKFVSSAAQGTAPLTVVSTTVVANLNADLLDGYQTATTATASTVAVRDGSGSLTALGYTSTVATGTAPLAVASQTLVANLNADMVDGKHAADFFPAAGGVIPQHAATAVTFPLELQNASNDWTAARKGVGLYFKRDGDATHDYGAIIGAAVTGDGTAGRVLEFWTELQGGTPSMMIGTGSYIRANGTGLGVRTDPSITLALGDNDTGLNWRADGAVQLMANNTAVAEFNTSGFSILNGKGMWVNGGSVYHTGNLNPLVNGDNWNTNHIVIQRNIGTAASYNSGHLELQSNDQSSHVILGFHRAGATACYLSHTGSIADLILYTNGGGIGSLNANVIAPANTSYGSRYVRNTIMSTSDPSGGQNGDIWIKYAA